MPLKFKDPGSPTISCVIATQLLNKTLLDLGASVNILSYSIYKQLGLGQLHPTSIVLQLDDRSMKMRRGITEDVLIQIDKFYYDVDFIVIDTQPVQDSTKHIPIILGRPFLATAYAHISCRTENMQLSFGNMTIKLNIFNAPKQAQEDDEVVEVDMIEALVDDSFISNHCDDPLKTCLTHFGLSFDSAISEVNALLDSAPIMDLTKWKEKIDPLSPEEKIKPFQLELLPREMQHRSLSDMKKVVRSEVLKLLKFYIILDSFQISLK